MRIDIITVLPELLEGFVREIILGRAQKKGLVAIHLHNLRDYATNKYRRVDDYPFGGFAGMVRSNATAAFIIDQLKTETTKEAILDAKEKKYDAPRSVMAEDVDMVLGNLKKIGALDE